MMTSIDSSARDEMYQAVVAAVDAAVAGTHLGVKNIDDIRAVEVTGIRVEAYVLVPAAGEFEVSLWRADRQSPYRTARTGELGEAVRMAVEGAVGGRRRTAAHRG